MKNILSMIMIFLLAVSNCPAALAKTSDETATTSSAFAVPSAPAVNVSIQTIEYTATASSITDAGITSPTEADQTSTTSDSAIDDEDYNGPTDEQDVPETTPPELEQTTGPIISTILVKTSNGKTIKVKVFKKFSNKMPANIIENLKYTKYKMPINFVRITVSKIVVRTAPEKKAASLAMLSKNQRMECDMLVAGSDTSDKTNPEWFRVMVPTKRGTLTGFVPTEGAEFMGFRISDAAAKITKIEHAPGMLGYGYVNNYKNRAGLPKMIAGKSVDAQGMSRDQAAPLYISGKTAEPIMYLPDGSLFAIRARVKGWLNITLFPDYTKSYWIPEKFTTYKLSPLNITKVIAVDRKGQNIMTFEKIGSKWTIRSRSLATTGAKTKYKFETPLGLFMAIEKRSKFNYLKDSTPKVVDGYAPYAIRFSGGAYNHGVPVAYIKGSDSSLKDPGMRENLRSLGTVPLSHKCVRNYTSHAKFVYDWVTIGSTAVLVFE